MNQNIQDVFGKVSPPPQISNLTQQEGAGGLSIFLSRAIQLAYMVAAVIFVFMVMAGAIQWILSGGDKEAVEKARKRITHAIIGITLLALTFVILRVLGQALGFSFFAGSENGAPAAIISAPQAPIQGPSQ